MSFKGETGRAPPDPKNASVAIEKPRDKVGPRDNNVSLIFVNDALRLGV